MASRKKALTGIKPTGSPHLGNIIGAIAPALELAKTYDTNYFIADAHALTSVSDADTLRQYTFDVAATWLALGLDPDESTFYRQSDITEDFELSWIFHCLTPKGLMNRAHAYKAAVDAATQAGEKDVDANVNMGVFSYPILMAADIIMYSANVVPVGQDQKQHVEIARDIAIKFNNLYGDLLTVPEPLIEKETATLPGLDHRKMSKSYDNTISIFCSDDQLWNQVKKFKTDSGQPGESRDPSDVPIFTLIDAISSREVSETAATALKSGDFMWSTMKELLFEQIKEQYSSARTRYEELREDGGYVERVLSEGAEKARAQAQPLMEIVRKAVGLR
ncbi:MAG TPA: tryptophan--tRNA ligase [Acidimicrobiia bacterium]|nr:tryptophan--tRNA ligase [Acidimicrobiia bacterium]